MNSTVDCCKLKYDYLTYHYIELVNADINYATD